jgi:hypothetical protein
MCRNIRTLHHLAPPATPDEVQAAALQFVRKVSGYRQVPRANAAAFDRAVEEVTQAVQALLDELVATAAPKTREQQAEAARRRAAARG